MSRRASPEVEVPDPGQSYCYGLGENGWVSQRGFEETESPKAQRSSAVHMIPLSSVSAFWNARYNQLWFLDVKYSRDSKSVLRRGLLPGSWSFGVMKDTHIWSSASHSSIRSTGLLIALFSGNPCFWHWPAFVSWVLPKTTYFCNSQRAESPSCSWTLGHTPDILNPRVSLQGVPFNPRSLLFPSDRGNGTQMPVCLYFPFA